MVDIDGGRLGSRRDVRTSCGGDTMLDIGTGDGVSVERLDIEDDGNDVKVEPEPRAQVGSLQTDIKLRSAA